MAVSLEKIPAEKTMMFDEIFDRICKVSNNIQSSSIKMMYQKISRIIERVADSNADVLQSNIVGRQLLFNDTYQTQILQILGFSNVNEVKKIIANCDFIESIGGASSMRDQMAFLIPCAIFAGVLDQEMMEQEAAIMFLIMFFKPYAARISQYFKHGVNEPRMLWTIEHMDERSDIKTQGTVLALLQKISKSSCDNYIDRLNPINKPNDKLLYDISMAGCYTRVNAVIKKIFAKYDANKNKTLKYEVTTVSNTDDDGNSETSENDIVSESAIKMNICRKTMLLLTRSPIDEKLLQIAVIKSFASGTLSATKARMDTLRSALNELIDTRISDIELLIKYVMDSFTSQTNSKGEKYNAADIQTPVFLAGAMKIFKSPNSKDINLLSAKKLLEDLITSASPQYSLFEKNTQRLYKNALYFYIITLIRKA